MPSETTTSLKNRGGGSGWNGSGWRGSFRTWVSHALPSSANFLLVNLDWPASDLAARLLVKGILVRDCASFGLPDSIRIAVRRREENEQLIEALAACLP